MIPPPALDSATADEILELAAVVAHGQERRFAPLAAYLAGAAAGHAGVNAALLVRSVREELEAGSQ